MFVFQVQTLKVLVNLSSNPDMMDDIVEAQVRVKNAAQMPPVKENIVYNRPISGFIKSE